MSDHDAAARRRAALADSFRELLRHLALPLIGLGAGLLLMELMR